MKNISDKGKKRAVRAISVITTAALLFSMIGTAVFASEKIVKDETVYVITEANGRHKETIVSDQLKNVGERKLVNDVSDLKNIENVKGDEKFTQGSDGKIAWQAAGSDIYYQGTTEKETPVTLDINYYLNGKEVNGSELEGCSGDVKIEIEYKNKLAEEGDNTIFAALTGFLAEDESFSNISVSSGKVIDDGNRKIVVTLAVPGISEIIDDPEGKIGVSDKVTISGKAKDFDLTDMMTVVTCDMFEDTKTPDFSISGMDNQIKTLDNGAKQLSEGSTTLYNGIHMLNKSSGELASGAAKLNKGADKLSVGSAAALEGSSSIAKGSKKLSQALDVNLGNMKNGAAALYDGSSKLCDGIGVLKASIDGNDSQPGLLGGAKSVSNGVKSLSEGTTQALSASNQYTKGAIGALEKMKAAAATDEEKANIDGIISALNESIKYQNMVSVPEELVAGAASVADGIGQISAGIGGDNGLAAGAAALKKGTGTLAEGLGAATADTNSLTSNAAALAKGAAELEAGQRSLYKGAKELASGMAEFDAGAGKLIDGAGKLDDGALKLNKGMQKLYREGIGKIVELYNGKLKGLAGTLDSLSDGGGYKTFTKLPDEMDGSVKFIYKTEVSQAENGEE